MKFSDIISSLVRAVDTFSTTTDYKSHLDALCSGVKELEDYLISFTACCTKMMEDAIPSDDLKSASVYIASIQACHRKLWAAQAIFLDTLDVATAHRVAGVNIDEKIRQAHIDVREAVDSASRCHLVLEEHFFKWKKLHTHARHTPDASGDIIVKTNMLRKLAMKMNPCYDVVDVKNFIRICGETADEVRALITTTASYDAGVAGRLQKKWSEVVLRVNELVESLSSTAVEIQKQAVADTFTEWVKPTGTYGDAIRKMDKCVADIIDLMTGDLPDIYGPVANYVAMQEAITECVAVTENTVIAMREMFEPGSSS